MGNFTLIAKALRHFHLLAESMRIGAVNFLNSKPLVHGLERLAPEVRVLYDLPSRLADSLAAGRFDVALIPSIEFFRTPGYRIMSDACVACRGPVRSVKLYFRVPPMDVQRVALDESSRTSAALAQVLLGELFGRTPTTETLPIGDGLAETDADAVLIIGDRAVQPDLHVRGDPHIEVWDLGERWWRCTSAPFVFAMWVARPEVPVAEVSAILGAARDEGVRNLQQIAAEEGPALGIECETAFDYLRDNLHFTLGRDELSGLKRFYHSCAARGLAPAGLESKLEICRANGCSAL